MLQVPEGFRVKATGGEAVLIILRTSGNEGSEVLRHLQRYQGMLLPFIPPRLIPKSIPN
jgi:hypothetical protein